MPSNIYDILDQFRKSASSFRHQGDRFERFVATYLRSDPQYSNRYSDIWLWKEWPDNGGEPDTGIDIVAKEKDGDGYCAIQCKFFDSAHTLQKSDIDSFFTASGKRPFTSRIIVSTTNSWSSHAEKALEDQQIETTRIRLEDLANSPVDWSGYVSSRSIPDALPIKPKKEIREHQRTAIEQVVAGLKMVDRGKLIMACGTGKTFTALKLAERLVSSDGLVLFLVPSISLLSQTLREWASEVDDEFRLVSFAVCSDSNVNKKRSGNEDIHAYDLAIPATTDAKKLSYAVNVLGGKHFAVVFSTYQSIQVIADAQVQGLLEFDLIICDEAHRTTGVTLEGEDESYFVRVHDQNFIRAKKRLYMTATPRIFSDDAKNKAKQYEAVLCSMDDEKIYGRELHRLGFSEAVSRDLLTDYKVLVLAVDEKYVSSAFQSQLADDNNELSLDDTIKIIGCWNGLAKRMTADFATDSRPMRRAVAFCRSIKDSQTITKLFSDVVSQYRKLNHQSGRLLVCEVDHVDGKMGALKRNNLLDWLKEEIDQEDVCRILSNARCLSEGVDVPALDAVMFLNPRNSIVDVVQSVGRVMRKADGKQYGYIILPIGVPSDVNPEDALDDNKKYKVVWQVLQALRSHDDRFNTVVNQIELNKSRPDLIQIIGVGGDGDNEVDKGSKSQGEQLSLGLANLEEWRDAIYTKLVVKCGDRGYWKEWAKDIAYIAERHANHIRMLIDTSQYLQVFQGFLEGLRGNINPDVTQDDAVEMLSQHMITKPVFDALFEDYSFVQCNPVSVTMQNMLDHLGEQSLSEDTQSLDKFYESVKSRVKGVDNIDGKQKILIELYDNFFKIAFPKMSDRLGIVYTPLEAVDFIINSVDIVLREEFGKGIGSDGVNILDPFTGTGTFMVRMIQSGLIDSKDLARKYQSELHANEIVLLAYYIAAINIEAAYHYVAGDHYSPFQGIVLTDTFNAMESSYKDLGGDVSFFDKNNKRISHQVKRNIEVIIGNPPYSVGQKSENDGNKNLKYPHLDKRIRETYAAGSTAVLKNSLYDSYIRAIRWASDRIKNQGIIAYVSNGYFIDSNTMDGLRKCLAEEFTSIYCFNLRGNARTQGEQRRMERGNVFGEGSRTPIAITLLIKNPKKKNKEKIFYHDIGDYLTREDKLSRIKAFGSIKGIPWESITPNASYDWINHRNLVFESFVPLGDKDGSKSNEVIFTIYSRGVMTCRDAWAYNFSKVSLTDNMARMIDFYNEQLNTYHDQSDKEKKVEEFIDTDPKKISWTREIKQDLSKKKRGTFEITHIVKSMYRPFCKEYLYLDRQFNNCVYQMPKLFPKQGIENWVICVTGMGASKDFSALVSNTLPDLEIISKSQCFPLYYYEKVNTEGQLFSSQEGEYIRKDAIPDMMLEEFKKKYNSSKISKEDIFYYVYGVLHSQEYKTCFASDLKKMLPRIPFVKDFWAFSQAGRALAEWHLNYEQVEPYPLKELIHGEVDDPKRFYRVEVMRFSKRGKEMDKSIIVYNNYVTLSGIPLEAYDYIVNGKSAIDWVVDRYRVTIDKDSGIRNDPNDWSDDPRYIIDLLKRIVRVSLETVKIVDRIAKLNLDDLVSQ